jgi:hypothetical protein
MQGKQTVIANYRSRYRNAKRKEKGTILHEVRFITGYNRKYAPRILNKSQAPQALLTVKGKVVKLKPPKKNPPIVPVKKSAIIYLRTHEHI